MEKTVTIRQAEERDLPFILDLYRQPDMDNGDTLSEERAKVIFQRMSGYPNYKIYVAENGLEIIGTYALAIMDNLAHMGAPSGLIEDVVVKVQWQNNGIGRQMMEDAIARCRVNGCYKAALSSNLKRYRAHRFYESLNFQKHGYSFLIDLK